MATGGSLRDKLNGVLKEQRKENLKGQKSGDFLKVLRLLHPNKYDDFIKGLTFEEKREMTEEMTFHRFFLKELTIWINNANLLELIFSAENCAEFCDEQLTEERFEQVIKCMSGTQIYEIFKRSDWGKRVDIIGLLEEEERKTFIDYACQNEHSSEFLALLQSDLENDEKMKDKIFQTFLELEVECQAIVMSSVPICWLDEVFDLFWEKEGTEILQIFRNMTDVKMVEILLNCNPKNSVETFELLSKADYRFSWEKVGWQWQIAIMERMKDCGLKIEKFFELEELIECYLAGDRLAQKFIFCEILPIFEEGDLNTFLKFYMSFDETKVLERIRILEMVYVEEGELEQIIAIKMELAGKIKRVLEKIEEIEIFEKVFLEHLKNVVK